MIDDPCQDPGLVSEFAPRSIAIARLCHASSCTSKMHDSCCAREVSTESMGTSISPRATLFISRIPCIFFRPVDPIFWKRSSIPSFVSEFYRHFANIAAVGLSLPVARAWWGAAGSDVDFWWYPRLRSPCWRRVNGSTLGESSGSYIPLISRRTWRWQWS